MYYMDSVEAEERKGWEEEERAEKEAESTEVVEWKKR